MGDKMEWNEQVIERVTRAILEVKSGLETVMVSQELAGRGEGPTLGCW